MKTIDWSLIIIITVTVLPVVFLIGAMILNVFAPSLILPMGLTIVVVWLLSLICVAIADIKKQG